jgi:hypothetical protein
LSVDHMTKLLRGLAQASCCCRDRKIACIKATSNVIASVIDGQLFTGGE